MSILGEEFDNAVNRLKSAANNFMAVYSHFVAIPPQFRTENWQAVKEKADSTRGIIASVAAGIDAAYKWARDTFGNGGIGMVGAVPLALPISIGAITAGISAIMAVYGYMTEELNKSSYHQKIAEENLKRASQGLPPLDLSYPGMPSTVQGIANVVKWAAIGGFIFFVAPKIFDALKRK